MLRIVEIFCIPLYLSAIFSALEWLEVIMVREADNMFEEILMNTKYV